MYGAALDVADDDPVDLVYRDYSVLDLVALQRKGVDVEPMRTLFRENRVISSITAELDQKSCWEILTDPQFTQKYFSGDERQVFRRHILWTRLLYDRRTTLPDGSKGELLDFVREERELLVIKPNRSYGGDRVILGHLETQENWEKEVDAAVRDSGAWVVQRLAPIPVSEFPVLGGSSLHMIVAEVLTAVRRRSTSPGNHRSRGRIVIVSTAW